MEGNGVLRKVIGLLTDFGLQDPYVSIMKAVIMSRCSSVDFIDITHNVESFNLLSASYILYNSFKWFPKGTVFLVVVDPGVGSKRKALAVRTKRYFFVGPDNGVLYQSIIDDGVMDIRIIENKELLLRDISYTFHGRDVFAPIASWLACDGKLEAVGPRVAIDDIVKLEITGYELENTSTICAKVVHIDKFGNIAFSVKPDSTIKELLSTAKVFSINGLEGRIGKTFSDVPVGSLVMYINSFGFLEVAVNKGSAAEKLRVNIGDRVCLKIQQL